MHRSAMTTQGRSAVAAQAWSAAEHLGDDRRDAWQAQLDDVYGGWILQGRLDAGFEAWCRHHGDEAFRVAECICDPCAAQRPRSMFRNGEEIVGLQVVLAGRERVVIDGQDHVAGAGDVLFWDTCQATGFQALDRLHKVSVMLPMARLRSWLPGSWKTSRRRFARGSTGANLLSAFIGSIAPAFLRGELPNPEGLTEAAAGLLVNVLGEPGAEGAKTVREMQLRRVQAYIDAHLREPALSPHSIARANRISLRYLHGLFDSEGITVSQYVIRQRLACCQRELGNPRMAGRRIGDIALACGFQNATHFARRFRERYGISPQQYRAGAAPGA